MANEVAVAALLKLGADPQLRSPLLLRTPLQLASSLLLPEILQLMLYRAKTSDVDNHGLFYLNDAHPFRTITMHGRKLPQAIKETIRVLTLSNSVDIMSSWGSTPLMSIAYCNYSRSDYWIAQELLEICDKTINSPMFSTMGIASIGSNGSLLKTKAEIALMLIDAGFSCRAVCRQNAFVDWNAMHVAVVHNSLDIVQALYDKDKELLEIGTTNDTKARLLHVVANSSSDAEVISLLLKLGANPLAPCGSRGITPLTFYIIGDH